MSASLLADLALMMAPSPEDVATRALDLVLQRSDVARAATTRLLDGWRGRSGPAVVRWASQIAGPDDGRTDLQGFNERDDTVAIFENKFWAGLTDNQPMTYIARLQSTDGVLAFIVPPSRVAVITHELTLRMQGSEHSGATFHRAGAVEIAHLPSGSTLIVAPWSSLLAPIAAALEAAQEYDHRSDLRQLEGLVAKMERDGFRPISATEITGDTPRLILRLGDLIDGSVQLLLTRPFADKKNLKATAGNGWYGHYLRLNGFGCQLVVTAWRWAAHGLSPVWLRVATKDWTFSEALRAPLRSVVDDPSWLFEVHRDGAGFWIPIRLLEGRERDAVIRDIVAQVERVANALARVPAGDVARHSTGPQEVPAPPPEDSSVALVANER